MARTASKTVKNVKIDKHMSLIELQKVLGDRTE